MNGDRVGLIGKNGSGKTTILRVMSGVYEPTAGVANINGHISSLININLGIDLELSGYENLKTRAAILGIKESQFQDYVQYVEELTSLQDYLYLPMRAYSSGMQMRLSFAAATFLKPDILIMDEWLSTGDLVFSKFANKRLNEIISKSNTLVITSHNLELLSKLCTRIVWLDAGKIIADGDPLPVIKNYQKSSNI